MWLVKWICLSAGRRRENFGRFGVFGIGQTAAGRFHLQLQSLVCVNPPPPSMTDLVLGGSDPPPSMTDLVLGGSDPPPSMTDLALGGGEVRAKIFYAPSLLNTSTE